MNSVCIDRIGLADSEFGAVREQYFQLPFVFRIFAAVALVSVVLVLQIRPRADLAGAPTA